MMALVSGPRHPLLYIGNWIAQEIWVLYVGCSMYCGYIAKDTKVEGSWF